MVIAGISPDPAQAEAITAWAKEYWEAVHPGAAKNREDCHCVNVFSRRYVRATT
jgi:hypothetical protein